MMTEQMVSVGGVKLYVQRITVTPQPTPTLVFLHDSHGGVRVWRDFPLALAQRCGLNALVYDRQGHGQSDAFTAPRQKNYLHLEAAQVLPQLLDALGISEVALFGHSDGATISLLAAALLPQRVRAVAVEGAHVFVEEMGKEGIRQTTARLAQTQLMEKLRHYHGEKADELYRRWEDTWLSPWFADWDIRPELGTVQCPVLVIQGTDDQYGTAEQVDGVTRFVSGPSETLWLEACGHSPHREAREKVLGHVSDFFRRTVY